MFEERAADALHDAAADLLVHQLRIDDGAAVFDAPVLKQLDKAGLGVHFHEGCLHAVGERKTVAARRVVARHHQLRLEIHRQRVGTEVRDAAHLGEG